jgi:hypothetical protein
MLSIHPLPPLLSTLSVLTSTSLFSSLFPLFPSLLSLPASVSSLFLLALSQLTLQDPVIEDRYQYVLHDPPAMVELLVTAGQETFSGIQSGSRGWERETREREGVQKKGRGAEGREQRRESG